MPLDLDLVRTILIKTDQEKYEFSPEVFVTNKYDSYTVGYYLHMLKEAGYIRIVGAENCTNPYEVAAVQGLTWDGYEYLNSVRSDTVWKKVKTSMANSCKETTLAAVKVLAEEAAIMMAKAAMQQL